MNYITEEKKMIQAATIIGTGLAITGLIGAGVGMGVVFVAFMLLVARNPLLRDQLFSYAILGFAFAEITSLLSVVVILKAIDFFSANIGIISSLIIDYAGCFFYNLLNFSTGLINIYTFIEPYITGGILGIGNINIIEVILGLILLVTGAGSFLKPALSNKVHSKLAENSNKVTVNLVYLPLDNNSALLFDKNSPNGFFLGLFINKSLPDITSKSMKVNGITYKGCVVPKEEIYENNTPTSLLRHHISEYTWESASQYVNVESEGRRVIASPVQPFHIVISKCITYN